MSTPAAKDGVFDPGLPPPEPLAPDPEPVVPVETFQQKARRLGEEEEMRKQLEAFGSWFALLADDGDAGDEA